MFGLLAAFGVAFGVLFMAVTMRTGRRRRRDAGDEVGLKDKAADMSWLGRWKYVHVSYTKLGAFYITQ